MAHLAYLYTVKQYKEVHKQKDIIISDIVQLYNELALTPEEAAKQRLVPNSKTKTVHIVFGYSTAGSVRQIMSIKNEILKSMLLRYVKESTI